MRKLNVTLAVALALVVVAWTSPAPTHAGLFGRRAANSQGYAQAPAVACSGGSCGVPASGYGNTAPAAYAGPTPLYHPVYTVPAAPAVPTAPSPVYASPSSPPPVAAAAGAPSALALVNQLRASYGRPPLSWDSTLAWYASRNNGVHAPGSNGGAGQCWAGVSDAATAVSMWARSPAHLAIILSATTSVGVSPCSTGYTLNAR